MASDTTITEHDMDPAAQDLVRSLRRDAGESEPDLSVDGLSESLLSRFLGLFASRR